MLPEYDHETEIYYLYFPVLEGEDEIITPEGWTWLRVMYLLIALLMIAAMLMMYVLPLLQQHAPPSPPPTPLPGTLI